jgi:hypothetical protein
VAQKSTLVLLRIDDQTEKEQLGDENPFDLLIGSNCNCLAHDMLVLCAESLVLEWENNHPSTALYLSRSFVFVQQMVAVVGPAVLGIHLDKETAVALQMVAEPVQRDQSVDSIVQ